jgi:cytoskeletal protein RodZ
VLEDNEHIGVSLKSAREAAGLTVEDVRFRTQLPPTVVLALEAEDFSSFASPVYAKSFLAQYSTFLNVDAQPWLEALEPGAFTSGAALQSLLDAPEPSPHAEPESSPAAGGGGWFSVLGLLALSAALVFAVIKSHEFFEARFGGDPPPQNEDFPSSSVERWPATPPDTRPGVVREDDELGKPPPRAIIVR